MFKLGIPDIIPEKNVLLVYDIKYSLVLACTAKQKFAQFPLT